MAGELVFITGATGFIGFAVLNKLLQSGYRARISVRKESQISTLSQHTLIAPYVAQGKVDFAVVPDITLPGAFDKELKDVVYVEHLASQLPHPTDNPERDIVQPAIHGTTSILTSALQHPSIRRIVITSSIAALLPFDAQTASSKKTYTGTSRVTPLPTGPWTAGPIAYCDAKALALDATDRFVAEKKPGFSVVNVMPGYVIGRNELADSTEKLRKGSNNLVLSIVTGVVRTDPVSATVVDVRDVAKVQVGALDERKVEGMYRNFVVDAGDVDLNDANRIARDAFPEAWEKGWLKEGSSNVVRQDFVSAETREVFGELRGFEGMVKSVVEQYVELKEKEV